MSLQRLALGVGQQLVAVGSQVGQLHQLAAGVFADSNGAGVADAAGRVPEVGAGASVVDAHHQIGVLLLKGAEPFFVDAVTNTCGNQQDNETGDREEPDGGPDALSNQNSRLPKQFDAIAAPSDKPGDPEYYCEDERPQQ